MRMFDRIIRWMAMALAVAPIVITGSMPAADCCRNSVAVVASLSGTATMRAPGSHEKLAVSSYDWLSEGMTIEVGPRSQAVLILLNGHRYELHAGAKATLTADAAPKITGPARELPALPTIAKLAPIVADSAQTSGAVRIRGAKEMSDLYPRAGIVAIPEKVSLRFGAVPEAASYRVVLENDGGDKLLNVATEFTELPVPSGAIGAGAHYFWHVHAFRSDGVLIGAGEAEFRTLSAEDAQQRKDFASALGDASGDPATLALLADVDLRLGLVAEACDEFNAALKLKPDDAALRRALDSASASMAGKSK